MRPSRRALLATGLAIGASAVSASSAASAPLRPVRLPAQAGPLPLVAELGDSPDRSLFAPPEQRLAPYLVTLAAMANDIDDSDTELRGYQAGGWWRTPSEPFNARICEQVATFAWFLTAERPWNPYRGDAALEGRLDAAIDYYLRLQHEDGSWAEYEAGEHSRAATVFALSYLSKTLSYLRADNRLPERRSDITQALHSAMTWFLDPDNDGVWTPGIIEFANQPAAGLAGSAKALALDPDRGLELLLHDRVRQYIAHAQSPAGFLYEPSGMDLGYNLNVTLTEFFELQTELGSPVMLPTVRRLADWFRYTVVPEPDGAGLVCFASGAARTPMDFIDTVTPELQQRDLGSRFVRSAPALAAFYPAAEDREKQRAQWAASPDPVDPLEPGGTNPRIPASIVYGETYPSRSRRTLALRTLPAVRRRRLTELRTDPQGQQYLFVRRPSCYLAAFFGTRPNGVVRAGMGLLWHPVGGTFVHGAQSSDSECWATVLSNGGSDGTSDLEATYFDGPAAGGSVVAPEDVGHLRQDLGLRWQTGGGNLTAGALITDEGLVREFTATMDATEQVPLVLRSSDVLEWSTGDAVAVGSVSTQTAQALRIRRDQVTLTIGWGGSAAATLTPTDRLFFADGDRRCHVLCVPLGRSGRVTYSFE